MSLGEGVFHTDDIRGPLVTIWFSSDAFGQEAELAGPDKQRHRCLDPASSPNLMVPAGETVTSWFREGL